MLSHARRALSCVLVSTYYHFSVYDNETYMFPDAASVPWGTEPPLVDCSRAKPNHPGPLSRPSREPRPLGQFPNHTDLSSGEIIASNTRKKAYSKDDVIPLPPQPGTHSSSRSSPLVRTPTRLAQVPAAGDMTSLAPWAGRRPVHAARALAA